MNLRICCLAALASPFVAACASANGAPVPADSAPTDAAFPVDELSTASGGDGAEESSEEGGAISTVTHEDNEGGVQPVMDAGGSSLDGGTDAAEDTHGSATHDAASDRDGATPKTIDYSAWVLQLPSGSGTSPTTVPSSQLLAGFSNAYFYRADDGGQAFMDPATGITTSGSNHCRTEMRESDSRGAQAAWGASGTNSLTVSGKIVSVGGGASGHVTVGQVFDGTDGFPLCELQYSAQTGGFQLLYEEAKGAGTMINLQTPVALGARYTFTLALSHGVLTAEINGKQAYTRAPSAAALTAAFYYKFGNYDQTAMAGAVSTAPYTLLEVYSAEVAHN